MTGTIRFYSKWKFISEAKYLHRQDLRRRIESYLRFYGIRDLSDAGCYWEISPDIDEVKIENIYNRKGMKGLIGERRIPRGKKPSNQISTIHES